MSSIGVNPVNRINGYNGWTQIDNFPSQPNQNKGAVAISTPSGRQIFEYPQTSLYNAPGKHAASGLNIYVFNPSAIGGPSTIHNTLPNSQTQATTPIANSPISDDKTSSKKDVKTKNIVKLTNDYIMTLESFLRSKDDTVRKQAIQDLVRRFEEENTRYENPSLTALLNIALQDSDVHNRMMAESVVAAGAAHGDENTILLLRELVKSDEMYGQEAKLASNALLNTSQTRENVENNDIQNETQNEEQGNETE